MAKQKTLIQTYREIQKIGTTIPIPWNIWRIFGGNNKVMEIVHDQVALTEDLVTLDEAREGVEFFVKHLGGTVDWGKK